MTSSDCPCGPQPEMQRSRMSMLLLLALARVLLPTSAHAQDAELPTPDATVSEAVEPLGYAEAIDEALREHEQHNYDRARDLLLQAHALFPNARTFRGLGKLEFELRNYGNAESYLSQALMSSVRPLDARLRTEVEGLLALTRSELASVQAVPSAPVSLPRVEASVAPNELATMPPKTDTQPTVGRGRKRWIAWSVTAALAAGTALAFGFAFRDAPTPRADGGSSGVVLGSP